MNTTSRTSSIAHRIRRYAAAGSLLAFPALLVVEAVLDPAPGGTGEVMFTAASDHAGALLASAVLLMLSGILMVPAVGGLLHRARNRGAGLANLAAVLGVLGGFGHFAIGMFYLVALALPGGDQNAMIAYIERLNATPALGAIAFPLILCFGLGVVAMAWAAWRTGLIGWWGPIGVTAVVVLHEVMPTSIPSIDIAALGVLTVVFGYLGVRIATLSDTEWGPVPQARAAFAPATV
ncbi:MAG TPA: hypothetical protein VIU11_22570 [Nakamurella sp.]